MGSKGGSDIMNIAELQKDPPDVLIVGSGGAGVCAAIEAAEAGARVAIVERASSFGGATFISGGGTFMVATPLQEREGEVDSVQMAAEDWLAWGDGLADEEWARTFIEQSRVALYDWLEDRGVKWTALIPQEGNRARRWHRPDGGGEALWRRLEAAARSAGVEAWIAEAPLVDLNVDEGRFRSAILEDRMEPPMRSVAEHWWWPLEAFSRIAKWWPSFGPTLSRPMCFKVRE